MICEISLLTQSELYECNYQINFDDFPLITPLESYYGWLYATNTVKQVEFQFEKTKRNETTQKPQLLKSNKTIKISRTKRTKQTKATI